MAKKRGGSPARRSVIKYWSTKKQGSKRPGLPEVNFPVPKSIQPYLASGGKKRRRRSKKTKKKKKGPTPKNPSLYARVKAEAKKKFKVYPSAYANAWLVRTYKKRGGTYA